MKNIKQIILSISIVLSLGLSAQVAINTDGSSADNSALLDIKSTEKGLLLPRMTKSQMNSIDSPVFGLIVMCSDCDPKGPYYFDGSHWLSYATASQSGMNETDVYNPTTGKIWMDRNLGASQVATSNTDADAYGDLYQWGRDTDGHEKRTSGITNTLSDSNTADDENFIISANSPNDWRSPQNDELWQGVSGINNPCPSGYRLPTEAEWETEYDSWASNNTAGAFGSSLKLSSAGGRGYSNGLLTWVDSMGYYWSSTVNGTDSQILRFHNTSASMYREPRAYGYSVRCIKE